MKSLSLLAFLAAAPVTFAANATTHLLHSPTLNRTQIVFSYAGDLWTVNRQGGTATRLTSGTGLETLPVFSPDGETLAFTGEYDGNIDVYTMPAAGGVPKRITYHPGADYAAGWTPDGQRILFRSNRQSFSRFTQLFSASKDGGLPQALPLPMAFTGAYSPDGRRVVYAPLDGGQFGRTPERWVAWRRYRGGDASYLWIANLADLSTEKIPRTDSNDINPMWIGDKIYFLSDRNGPMTLFRYDPATKAVTELIKNPGPDIRSASAGPGGIVYEQFGQIAMYDLSSAKTHAVPIEIEADLTEVRPHVQSVEKEIRQGRISPTGVRAVFEAHGEILTAPVEKGDIRNLTQTPGVMERTPAWSPDGQWIAYFSDESGEYALHVKPQSGEGEGKKIPLAGKSAFYFAPHWSPDSKQIAFNDNQLNLWRVEIASGQFTKIDTDRFYTYGDLERDLSWSPDSKWIAYAKFLPNRLNVINVYSLDSGQSTQVTDGLSDARYPAFDRDGKYLYFTASTNYGPGSHPLDMTSDEHQVTRSVYALVLPSDTASPVEPESDEEKAVAPKPEDKDKKDDTAAKPVRVDLAGLTQRIVALPIPARNYVDLEAGRAGVIYLLEEISESLRNRDQGANTLSKFDLKTRKVERLAQGVSSFDLSFNGEKMLLKLGRGGEGPAAAGGAPPEWVIAPAGAPLKAGEGVLHLAGMEVKVDPLAEWKQMYREVWRIERGYFYDANLHGLDAAAMEKKYQPYLETLASRDDLNYLFQEMLGDITSSHLRGGGGSVPRGKPVPGGLLGADYEIVNGHYRFKRIYTGESWNPQLRAPLSGPGISVKEGDYLLDVNGHALSAADDLSALLEGTSGKRVLLRVGPDPSGANGRVVTVEPVASEQALRNLAWIEDNRRKVDALSGRKLAYVYIPDTAEAGLTSFNRYFFAQVDKQGVVIDERFNGGGQVADYIIDVLDRPLLSYNSFRYGAVQRSPAGAILGPKVMIINEVAGSGGDMMPWMFRYTKTGTLVGKRTWGGLIGVLGFPQLMDGGTVTAPNVRIFSPSGEWIAENTGVAPDVEVELDPKSVASGHDPQLERAVKIALEGLEKNPPPEPHRPAYPDYQHPSEGGGSRASKTVR
ncbi:MAG TPA: PDZ domain-containing protein [Bryobacteraceae bacterium]|jgi:tricorn protease|nr:PDZ domain-containing protein [Bryobacteraceae bacterium]